MPKQHLNRSAVPQHNPNKVQQFKFLNKNASVLDGWKEEGNNANVLISIRFVQSDFQCFSDWDAKDMKVFWAFSEKLHNYTWQMVYGSSKKGEGKTGFAYTEIPIENYPSSDFKKKFSPDITLFELRVDEEKRVHGFRDKPIFYLCWLDKNHQISKE